VGGGIGGIRKALWSFEREERGELAPDQFRVKRDQSQFTAKGPRSKGFEIEQGQEGEKGRNRCQTKSLPVSMNWGELNLGGWIVGFGDETIGKGKRAVGCKHIRGKAKFPMGPIENISPRGAS